MRVLIVESNPALSQLWESHLERQGARVTGACDEAQAVETLRESEIDIIVLDLVL